MHDDSTIPDSVQCSYEAAGGGGRRERGGREEGRNKKSNGPCDLTVQQSDINQEGTLVEYLKCEVEGGLP